MDTALATPTKPKSRKVNSLGKLLSAHHDILGAWIVSGLDGHLEVRHHRCDGTYSIQYCAHESLKFCSLTIYHDDRNFELKKRRILDYLSGKIDFLEKEDEHL